MESFGRYVKQAKDRVGHLAQKWFRTKLTVRQILAILSCVFVATLVSIAVYMFDIFHEQKIHMRVLDVAGVQRSRIERYTNAIVMASLGHTSRPEDIEGNLEKTIEALISGGKFSLGSASLSPIRLPPAPNAAIRNKLNEQRALLESLKRRKSDFLARPAGDPRAAVELQKTLRAADLLRISANDAVKLYIQHASGRINTYMKWGLVILFNVAVFGILLIVQVRRANQDLESEVRDRKRAMWRLSESEEKLRKAHEELELNVLVRTVELSRANKNLETLLYVISHDLKEPLRAIENFSTLLAERNASILGEKALTHLGHIQQGVARLYQLLDDILVLSRAQRIGAGRVRIEGSLIVREAMDRLKERIAATKARVLVDEILPTVRAEKVWVVEALYNLLENALKFSRNSHPPEVEIAAYGVAFGASEEHSRGEIGFVVRDRGPGVAEEHAERIFQLFQRCVGREIEGTGAGLAIVRQVASSHGGRAWVEPRPGGGSAFYVTFSDQP